MLAKIDSLSTTRIQFPPSLEAQQTTLTVDNAHKGDAMGSTEYLAGLTDHQYWVTQEKGTESPFTGEYWTTKEDGIYCCVCCGSPLFSSEAKYDSGTGWPSFWSPLDLRNITTQVDSGFGMERTEVMCANCSAHLGHVFPDGPIPTGLRYCLNSASLQLEKSS